MIKTFVPHWFHWCIALVLFAAINLIIVESSKSHTLVESNVSCSVKNMEASKSIYVSFTCKDIESSISDPKQILAYINGKTNLTCSIYKNKNIKDCEFHD